jgi:UDP-N-acetylglucosamine 2-epimerase
MASEKKLLTIVGARPQFIKAAAMSAGVQAWNHTASATKFTELIIHTGQHYDHELSDSFFEELMIPKPRVNLDVKSGSHAVQTAKMMTGLETLMQEQSPDWVIVFGDTNSTLAGVLSAAKLKIPVAHVEAGLREHNRHIPEEVNKIVADHLSDWCFAPTKSAMEILAREGLADRAVLVGDIMLDTTRRVLESQSNLYVAQVLERYQVAPNGFALATTHRAIIRERPELLKNVLEALREMPFPVVLPLHPSTRSAIALHNLGKLIEPGAALKVVQPVKYSEMIVLLSNCRIVLSDSGGLIKEAYFFKKPCITLDYQTEWVETLEGGWNVIAGPQKEHILKAASAIKPDSRLHREDIFGVGQTARKILETLSSGN